MQSIKLTPSQQAAVENEGGALLVAAAAGSGKTKVLVDRLMRSILDPVHPKNVDDFLIITYTKAAAAELRAKISAELSRQVALQPDNRHLQRQMRRIYQTKISTIHAFCADLLRSYGHIIDVPSDFRVTEETQTLLLRQAVKERLFEQLYETYEDDPELQGLLDQFGYGRDDRNLEKLLFSVYDKVQSFSDPQRWLTECRRKLELDRDADAGQTPWGRYLLQELRRYLQQQIDIFEREIKLAQEDGALAKAYVPVFAENVSQMRRLLACRTWDEAVQAWPREFGRLSAARSCEAPELMQAMKSDRTRCWDGLKQRLGYFYGDSREVLEDLASSHAGLRGVIRLVELFSSAYQTEKRRQRSLDFSDLEHESLRLLFQKDTALPSALAREVSEQFSEIMVDEYQDSNEVQDRIFAAISKQGQNLFFVGDVKQSIYRFRLADPRIFLNKYQSFAEAAEAAPGEPRRILLSENFRSGKAILEAVNQVFETVMSRQFGDMDYTEAEKLKPGLTLPPISGTPVELHCIAYSGADDTEESGDKTQVEAAFLARRIQRLLHEGAEVTTKDGVRPVQPGDIVILLRSLSNTAPVYLEKLHALGIPAVSDKAGSILDTKEAEVFLSLLQVLENPHQDIPLVAVLASPIFGLTADELAELRLKNRTGDLYEALKCQASQSRKVQNCLSLLQALRDQSKWLTLQELLDALVHSTGLLDVFAAMQAGEQRVKNLQALLSLADTYCAAQPATLLDFVQYLLGLKNAGIHVVADTQDAGDCVKIMSIHKSKGLEFPVVCLPDLSRKFNDADLVQEVLLHEDLGLGGNCFDPTTMTKFPTIGKKAISLELQKQNRAEELRVLYVAMTRAKDRLIMSYCSRYLQREVTALSQDASFPARPEVAGRVKNPGGWILLAALCRKEAQALFELGGRPHVVEEFQDRWEIRTYQSEELGLHSAATAQMLSEEKQELQLPSRDQIQACLDFCYPYESLTQIPSKLTATQLKGRNLDLEAQERAAVLPRTPVLRVKPVFLQERPLTAAEKGTATHLFLQFADYHQCQSLEGIEQELARLTDKQFLTQKQAEAVNQSAVYTLFVSELGQRILRSNTVKREFKFTTLAPAGQFYQGAGEEPMMLQGVIDCFLIEQDGITVLDFKTDYVTQETVYARAEQYRGQLDAYAQALERMYHLPVKEKLLYFFAIHAAIPV